jgi:ribosomal-protein-alanine N-acetyltransferase
MKDTKEYILHTERLLLRPLIHEDIPAIFNILGHDKDLVQFLSFDLHKTLEDSVAYFKRATGHYPKKRITWAIIRDDVFCGTVSLHTITRKINGWTVNSADLSYWLGSDFRKQGIMSEAARRIIEFALNAEGLHKIRASHRIDNIPSQKLLEKLGFRHVGTERAHYHKDGKWWDREIYEMILFT